MIKTKVLQPIKDDEKDFEEVEKRILKVFRQLIYIPLLKEIGFGKDTLKNSINSPLADAILTGHVTYRAGAFRGKFSAKISKELTEMGAKFNKVQRCWKIPIEKVDPEIQRTMALAEYRFNEALYKMNKALDQLRPEAIAEAVQTEEIYKKIISKTIQKVDESLKGITVVPKLTQQELDSIAKNYTNNLSKYIEDFSKKQILDLRQKVQKSVLYGNRYESMIKMIQHSYGVTETKAKFLASQETKLMTASLKAAQYQSAGVDEYIWTCVIGSEKHPVRPDHQALNGTRQRFSDPPITNEKGDRNNPQEDYNCRCTARPIAVFRTS